MQSTEYQPRAYAKILLIDRNNNYYEFLFPGKRFAVVEAMMGLANILDRYEMTVSSKTPNPLKFNPRAFIPQPVGGIWLNMKKIQA
jgi:hypothetical protein